ITSGAFLNDLLTPAVRFSPWVTPLLGPIAPMVSSDDCRALTGIPVTQTTSESALWPLLLLILLLSYRKHTRGNQSELVFLICHLLLLDVSSWEEESHHPLEELVHQLDGERHHVHLTMDTKKSSIKHDTNVSLPLTGYQSLNLDSVATFQHWR
uniref:Uncharacterized protein n=1 Tax=Sparus aurata TaxID=8175 RepID=A0A671TK81_SPAAU